MQDSVLDKNLGSQINGIYLLLDPTICSWVNMGKLLSKDNETIPHYLK